jgi:hypothetical protein
MVSYLWGMRLALFVKEMEQVADPEIKGFGNITKDEEYDGEWIPEFPDV